MPKGYWIAQVDVRDPERYKDYVAAAKPAFEKFGANFVARGGAFAQRAQTGWMPPPPRRRSGSSPGLQTRSCR